MSAFITPDVEHPAPRNLSSELDQIYNANAKYAGPYYDLEAKYGKLYNRLGLSNLGEQLQGWTDEAGAHHAGTLEIGKMGNTAQREADVSDVERLGGRVIDANLAANPFLKRSLGLLSDRENDSPVLQTLNDQAMEALRGGGELTAQDQRAIDQATRSGFSDRGTVFGNQSIGAELLNRDAARRARAAAGQQFATSVQGLNQAQNDFVGRATQIDATSLSDPWMALLNRASGAGGSAASMTPIGAGTKVFDPFNPYAQDLFNTNFNEEATRGYANAQNQAATRQAIATVASGFIGSDIRMKEKIMEVGTVRLRNGAVIPRYEFEYRAGCVPLELRPVRYSGVMADDVEEVMPAAVSVDPRTGFKRVNYEMLGIEMKEAA